MSMQTTIQDQLKDAMRAKDTVRLETLRYVLSELKYAQIARQHELSNEESIEVLSREVKKRRDAIEMFKKSGRDGLVADEEAKLTFITTLLPEQLSAQEVKEVVDEVVSRVGKANMGVVMKEVMAKLKGKADGRMVSKLVQDKMKTEV